MNQHDAAVETLKATPPLAASSLILAGIDLQSWVLIVSLIWGLLNLFFMLKREVYQPWKDKRNATKRSG